MTFLYSHGALRAKLSSAALQKWGMRMARVVMARLQFLIIYFFFVIPASPSSSRSSSSYGNVVSVRPGQPRMRTCTPYQRCQSAPRTRIADLSTLEGDSRMRYGQNLTSMGGAFPVGFFVANNNNTTRGGTTWGPEPPMAPAIKIFFVIYVCLVESFVLTYYKL